MVNIRWRLYFLDFDVTGINFRLKLFPEIGNIDNALEVQCARLRVAVVVVACEALK